MSFSEEDRGSRLYDYLTPLERYVLQLRQVIPPQVFNFMEIAELLLIIDKGEGMFDKRQILSKQRHVHALTKQLLETKLRATFTAMGYSSEGKEKADDEDKEELKCLSAWPH